MICHRRRISIHAPHEGERLEVPDFDDNRWNISIHAPHEGERPHLSSQKALPCYFNPRSPRGGATFGRGFRHIYVGQISIHAPHEGERRTRGGNFAGI